MKIISIISLLFLLVSCKTKQEVKFFNLTNNEIENLILRTNTGESENKPINIKPQSTVKAVLWMTEKSGQDGCFVYSYRINDHEYIDSFGYYTNGGACAPPVEVRIKLE